MQLHIVVNTEDKTDLQKIVSLLSEYEIESLTWGPPQPTGPVFRDQKDRTAGFVEAARSVQPGKDFSD